MCERKESKMINLKNDETVIAENGPQKTVKQLQKEAKKLAKLDKFQKKQGKKENEKPANVKEVSTQYRYSLNAVRKMDIKLFNIHMEPNHTIY